MYGYGGSYGYPPWYGWAIGQAPPAPAPVAPPPPGPPSWIASEAGRAQHGRYVLQEALAWLIGAGVTQRTIHQDVDRLMMQLQETDPPFPVRIGEWHFDGTHWTLQPKTVYAASGWGW